MRQVKRKVYEDVIQRPRKGPWSPIRADIFCQVIFLETKINVMTFLQAQWILHLVNKGLPAWRWGPVSWHAVYLPLNLSTLVFFKLGQGCWVEEIAVLFQVGNTCCDEVKVGVGHTAGVWDPEERKYWVGWKRKLLEIGWIRSRKTLPHK